MGVFGDYQKQGGLTRRKALVLGAAGLTVFGATGLRAADMKPGETGRVIRVIDGDSFVLEDGLIIRLAGIEAPRTALKSKKREAWPFAGESRAALSGLINKREVQLFYGGESRDRYGRSRGAGLHNRRKWAARYLDTGRDGAPWSCPSDAVAG
ncbi:thermonuclease family protein [Litorimonas sp. RW-G-Af-16]|uniref:thermonuclease family protein n=1 Tax=Litorimonas sp. RW-G-Af-16 TaxID=3241168 RepID=UPI003AAE6048